MIWEPVGGRSPQFASLSGSTDPMIFTDFAPFDFGDFTLYRGDLPLMVTAPSALLSDFDRLSLPANLVDIRGNLVLPETIDWRTPFPWEFASLNTDVAPRLLTSGVDPLTGAVRSGLGLTPEQTRVLDSFQVDTVSGQVTDPQSGSTWRTVQEFLRSGPGAALGIAALGLAGTGLGQLVSGGGGTLTLPERQSTAAQTAGSEAFARALGQPSLANVLGAPAGGTTPVGVGGTLSGSQNLEALIRASLSGQRSVAELMAERAERERLADQAASPAEAAIRARALAELPGFLRPAPGGTPTLAQPIDLTRMNGVWQMPRGAAVSGQAYGSQAPATGAEVPWNLWFNPNPVAGSGRFWSPPDDMSPDQLIALGYGKPTASDLRQYGSDPSLPPELAGGAATGWDQWTPTLAPLTDPLAPELDAGVRALLGGREAYTDPGLAALRARIGGTLAPAQPLSDEIQQMLAAEIGRVAGGQISNPALERRLAEEERAQREFLARALGPNYELSTAGQAALGELRQRQTAIREEDRRTTLATLSPLEESRRRFGIEFPEATRARELGLLLPEERARAEFGYQAPRSLRLSELGLLAPESRARYQFGRTQPLEEARFGEAVRSRGFEERLGLTGLGRTQPVQTAQTLGQMVPISPLLGIETEATRAQREALQTQAAIESFRAQQAESASLAQQLGSVFGLAGAFGLGRGLTGA